MSLYYINNFYVSKISLEKRIKILLSFLEQGDICFSSIQKII